MSFANRFHRSRQGPRRGPSRPRPGSLPRLEVLEDRTLPSTFLVTNLKDSGAGSLPGRPGRLPTQGSHRSGRARFEHPARPANGSHAPVH